jgi:hypothetical protein
MGHQLAVTVALLQEVLAAELVLGAGQVISGPPPQQLPELEI